MRVTNISRLAGATVLLLAGASLPATAQTAKAELKDRKGKEVGSADLTQNADWRPGAAFGQWTAARRARVPHPCRRQVRAAVRIGRSAFQSRQ